MTDRHWKTNARYFSKIPMAYEYIVVKIYTGHLRADET